MTLKKSAHLTPAAQVKLVNKEKPCLYSNNVYVLYKNESELLFLEYKCTAFHILNGIKCVIKLSYVLL